MSEAYEEVISGETILRFPPSELHEALCARLHSLLGGTLNSNAIAKLLPCRNIVQLGAGSFVRPDLAMVTKATNKLWLAVEVISSDDHRSDTVIKKTAYEENSIPRLWMVDPRYNNVEVYHGSQYGMVLKSILAGREILEEPLLPGFQISINELFGKT